MVGIVYRVLEEIYRLFKVFLFVSENSGCSISDIVRGTGFSAPSVRNALRALAALGWISIEMVRELPRRDRVTLTERGKSLRSFVEEILRDVERVLRSSEVV